MIRCRAGDPAGARADPQVGLRHVTIGDAEVGLGRLDAAIEEYRKAIDVGYHNRIVNLAGAYALQGKMDEAKAVLAEALRANPKLTVKMLSERFGVAAPRWRKACARRGCRRSERDPKTRGDPGRRRRRLQPGSPAPRATTRSFLRQRERVDSDALRAAGLPEG